MVFWERARAAQQRGAAARRGRLKRRGPGGVAHLGDGGDEVIDACEIGIVFDFYARRGKVHLDAGDAAQAAHAFFILPTQDGQEKPLARRVVLVMVLLMTVSFSRGFVNDCVTTLWKPPGTHHEKSQSRTSSHVFYVKRTP